MKVRTPDYYDNFKCIAGACEDTCCAGWQVDVDDASFAYYKTITGEFGDYLHSVMIEPTKKAEGQFRIRENGRCPFLADDNLCDLYRELGEEALCVTCDQYPRYSTEFGNLRETGIALSCKTAAELILRDDRTPGFREFEDANRFPSLNDIDGTRYLCLMEAREKAYQIIWNREFTIWERLVGLLYFATDLQRKMRHPERMKDVISRYTDDYIRGAIDAVCVERVGAGEIAELYDMIFCHYMHQTIIKTEWPELVETVYRELYDMPAPWTAENAALWKTLAKTGDYPDISGRTGEFLQSYARNYEWENLATYFTFRYFCRGILDGDVLTKVKMGIISILVILQCDAAVWWRGKHGGCDNEASLTFADQVEITHLYSREVEHSEENFAALCRIFAKRREFTDKNLVKLLLSMDPENQFREPL